MVNVENSYMSKLGLENDYIVQELGWDEDIIFEISKELNENLDDEIADETFKEVVDVILFWWRDGDGDLVDEIMDAMTLLSDQGFIWILTPKKGELGYVDVAEVAEAAKLAGLNQTLTENFDGWLARRLDQRKK